MYYFPSISNILLVQYWHRATFHIFVSMYYRGNLVSEK